jgi:amino acid permease
MESDHKGFQHRGASYAESEMKKHAEHGFYETKEVNAVSSTADDVAIGENTVHRALEQRHISMIAIGGTIGESHCVIN